MMTMAKGRMCSGYCRIRLVLLLRKRVGKRQKRRLRRKSMGNFLSLLSGSLKTTRTTNACVFVYILGITPPRQRWPEQLMLERMKNSLLWYRMLAPSSPHFVSRNSQESLLRLNVIVNSRKSSLKFDQLMDNYLVPFEEQD